MPLGTPAPAEEPFMAAWWFLRLALSAIVAAIVGAVGYAVADGGFKREMSNYTVHYDRAGAPIAEEGTGTFSFFGIELLKSNNMGEFITESNRIRLRIMIGVVGVCALCGLGLGMAIFRFVTRKPALAWQT